MQKTLYDRLIGIAQQLTLDGDPCALCPFCNKITDGDRDCICKDCGADLILHANARRAINVLS